jgi:hypothetical protein
MGGICSNTDIHTLPEDLAGYVKHEHVGSGTPNHVSPRPLNFSDIFVGEADTVDQYGMVIQTAGLHQHLHSPLGFRIESFLQMGNEGMASLQRSPMFNTNPIPPLQIEGGTLMGKGILPNDPDGKFIQEGFIELMGEMVVHGADPGDKVLVGSQKVRILQRNAGPFLEYGGGFQILVPFGPIQVVTSLRRAYPGKVISPQVIVDIDESGIHNALIL